MNHLNSPSAFDITASLQGTISRRSWLLATGAMALGAAAHAQAPIAPKAGVDYTVLERPAMTEAPAGKVEVIEFFSYSCPHCHSFDPTFQAWAKTQPKHVHVRRVPVGFLDSYAQLQRLFYTLESMGQLEKLHSKVFNTIHVDRQRLNNDNAVFTWASKQGLEATLFKNTYNSFAVATKVSKATQLQNAYGVMGVPSFGVAGQYFVDTQKTGSLTRSLQVVSALASKQK